MQQEESIVLLKNEDGFLPFNSNGIYNILVTGPNANNHTILGDWAINQPEDNVITIYEGFKKIGERYGHNVDFFDSNENIKNITDEDIDNVLLKAQNYDHIILVIGDNSIRHLGEKGKTAGENVARSSIDLAGNQLELVQGVSSLGIPVTIVLVNGKPIAEPWLSENMPAIIEAWEPGHMGDRQWQKYFLVKLIQVASFL